jgi:hypothetical protein
VEHWRTAHTNDGLGEFLARDGASELVVVVVVAVVVLEPAIPPGVGQPWLICEST